jgi:hypothetical protein
MRARRNQMMGVLGVSVAAMAVAGQAGATVTSRLVYVRKGVAESCPDERALRAAVVERLGYDPFFPWAEQTVVVRMSGQASKLRAELELVDSAGVATGARELSAPVGQCEELLRSLALTLSITLDPMSVNRAASSPAPTMSSSPAPLPSGTDGNQLGPDEAPKTPTLDPPRDAPRSLPDEMTTKPSFPSQPGIVMAVYAGPLAILGVEPASSLGGRVGLDVGGRTLAGFAELRMDLPASAISGEGGRVHARFWGSAFGPCVRESVFAACGLVMLGSMPTWATEVEVPREEALFYAATGARLQAKWPVLERWGVDVVASADGMKVLTVNQLRLHGQEVWRSPAFALALGLAVNVRFP